MSVAPIEKEIALCIGLAARELPDTDPARLLRVLENAIGLPPTAKKLSGLSIKEFKQAADGEFADIDTAAIKSALSCLKGEPLVESDQLPPLEAYRQGDMPTSIRVACASNVGEMLDGHFGSCRRFLIYQVSESENRLIDIRPVEEPAEVDDKNSFRASLIDDCQILFVGSIGGPAAAKVVRAGIHPIKKPQTLPAREEIRALQQVIGKDAPPWLAKAMGQSCEERIRFAQEAEA
ncbi:MAG: dinitrogenase iron-molybdenum cofactor biosynthesis protein [Candidatus Thiodiazotropha sp.]